MKHSLNGLFEKTLNRISVDCLSLQNNFVFNRPSKNSDTIQIRKLFLTVILSWEALVFLKFSKHEVSQQILKEWGF